MSFIDLYLLGRCNKNRKQSTDNSKNRNWALFLTDPVYAWVCICVCPYMHIFRELWLNIFIFIYRWVEVFVYINVHYTALCESLTLSLFQRRLRFGSCACACTLTHTYVRMSTRIYKLSVYLLYLYACIGLYVYVFGIEKNVCNVIDIIRWPDFKNAFQQKKI